VNKYFKPIREIFLFSIPVVAGKISEILFGIGDVIVAGRYSTIVLGAIGVASAFLFPGIIFGIGVLSAISPIKARKIGAGEGTESFPVSSLLLATGIGAVLTVLSLLTTRFVVPLFGYEPEFERLIQIYLTISSFSIIPAMIFSALKELLLARSHTVVPNLLIFLFNFFNVAANVLLMFGLGMGIAGAAVATLLSRSLMALVLYFYTQKKTVWHGKVCSQTVFEVLKSGIPAGGISLVVASVFAIVALLVGKMSVVAAATNNVLINVTTFTFMVPLALSGVTAVKVGHAYGAGKLQEIRRYAGASVIIGVTVALLGAMLFLLLPGPIFRIFTNQPDVIAYGSVLLLYVAIYQIPDALQEIFVGALRGIGETTVPLVLSFISIWLIGLSSGCYLAYVKNMGAAGLWLGLSTGLVVLGIILAAYFALKMKQLDAASR
jgi:MATE family multidrug resistance protein